MAKSLRSKWKRKMRAIKRVRYGQKELERLKKMLENDEENVEKVDIKMKDKSDSAPSKDQDETMDTSEVGCKPRNSKTLMDKNGTFPVWLHPRQRRKITAKNKKKKKLLNKNKP